jgi:DNA-binding CsgD family transcriptional regulator
MECKSDCGQGSGGSNVTEARGADSDSSISRTVEPSPSGLPSQTRLQQTGSSPPSGARGELSRFWQGLIEGELHVVSAFFLDHRCFAVASRCVREPLNERERTLLRRGFLAEPQKVLAADLRVSGTTVSVLIGRALRKLGLERRMGAAPLAVVLSALHHFEAIGVQGVQADTFEADGRHYVALSVPELDPNVLAGLTDAERNVALLLAAGLNQQDIAQQRGTSGSTIANQIASISRKLGVGGRFALIRRWAELQWAEGSLPPLPLDPAPSEATPEPLLHGELMAERYEVQRVLGRGGMGTVYRCRDLRNGELVAVKRVIPPARSAAQGLAWFVAESQALSAVDHEHVVRAREFGQLGDGTAFLAMDLVEGVTLEDITSRSLPFPLIWLIVDQVLSALVHTHARGVVHGDIKPLNVMVTSDASGGPHAFLFDFGLARLRGARLDSRLGQRAVAVEAPVRAGTPGYMAPEQILGQSEEISWATDLYGLGCVIHCLLCGCAPCAEGSADVPGPSFAPLPRLVPTSDTPPGLVDFVMRLLERRPRERAPSTAATRQEWQRFRPDLEDVPALWSLARERCRADASLLAPEAVATEAPLPRASLGQLSRSATWLPGLLAVRPSPFVGRVQLTSALTGVFAAVAAAEAPLVRAVLLSGPRGIGKSRLADWLCTDVEERGMGLALRGHLPADAPPADSLAVALAQHLGADGNRTTLRRALSERCFCSADELALASTWIHTGGAAEDPALSPVLSPELLQRVVQQLAGRHCLVLWLDDLTSLSAETLAWLEALPEQRPGLRMLIIATLKPEALAVPKTARAVQLLRDHLHATTLQVGALDTVTTSALVSAALSVEASVALKLALQSGGNPLDALERLCSLAASGRVS